MSKFFRLPFRRRRAKWVLLWALVTVPAPGPALAGLVINEFLADPVGSDGGREFVELMNTGQEIISLEGVSLQFANGAEGAVWFARWTGASGISLAPGARFLIVDRNWQGEPSGQAEVQLGLQNGPDALRLVTGETVLDMVGYGPLTDGAMMENSPVSISPGLSAARKPDGWDTGDNGLDFVQVHPTPGELNFHPFSVTVKQWDLDPPSVDRPGQAVRFSVTLLNGGTETLPAGPVSLQVGGRQFPTLLDLMAPNSERQLTWFPVPEMTGLLALEIRIPLPAEGDTLILNPGSLQVGPGELILNEVLAGPGQGQGEWFEIAALGPGMVSLAGYQVRDEDGDWRPLPDLRLAPGDLVVMTQDSLALAGWHSANHDHGAVTECPLETVLARQHDQPGWPSLNNSPPDSRDFADRLYLANPDNVVVDHVTIEGDAGSDVSLERLADTPRNPGAANWASSTSIAGSSPGCPNSVSLAGPGALVFTVAPRILDRNTGTTTIHFLFTLTAGEPGWSLEVYNLWGGRVRDFGGDSLGPGPRDLPWNGADDRGGFVPAGGYVAVLKTRGISGQVLARHKALLAVR